MVAERPKQTEIMYFTEYLARLDQGDMIFSDEVVVKDRVGVTFSGKGVGSEGGRRDRKSAISDNKFETIDHIQE